MGWGSFLSDAIDTVASPVSDVINTVGNTAGGLLSTAGNIGQNVINNPLPAALALGTGNVAPLLGYAITPQSTSGNSMASSDLFSGLLSGLGGYLQNQSNVSGNQTAAQASQFRPVGITNTFGTSNFQVDPATGQMISAGYSLSPQLQGYQNTLMGNNAQALNDASQIQAMGRQYMAQSPQQQAQQYITNQQALLQPGRDTESARLANQLQQTGRTGVSVAQGGGLGMANPEQQALANARAMQDLQLAANATQAGQQQYQFGQGLLSSAYQPFSVGLSASGAVEQMGQQPFGLSSELAGRSSTAGSNAAGYLKSAGQANPFASLLTGAGTNSALGTGLAGLFGNNNSSIFDTSSWMPTSTFTGGGDLSSLVGGSDIASLLGL